MRKQLPFFAATMFMLLISGGLQAQSESDRDPDVPASIVNLARIVDEPSFELIFQPAYPNPTADGTLTLIANYNGPVCEDCLKVSIYSLKSGEIFLEEKFTLPEGTDFEQRLNVAEYPSGMYYVIYEYRDQQARDLVAINR